MTPRIWSATFWSRKRQSACRLKRSLITPGLRLPMRTATTRSVIARSKHQGLFEGELLMLPAVTCAIAYQRIVFAFCSNQSARKLSQFAESAMAVKRVILQQFSMQLNYMNKERSNIYQPSAQPQQKNSDSAFLPDMPPKKAQTTSLGSDDEHYEFKRDSESCDSQPLTPSETSDEDIQTILDNVLINNSNNNAMKNIIKKCDDASSCTKSVDSPLQSRRRQARQLYIICPTPSGWKERIEFFFYFFYLPKAESKPKILAKIIISNNTKQRQPQ